MTLDADAPAEARGVDDHGPVQHAEHALSVLALALLTLLPIAEIVLRRFDSGVPGGTPFVQHLTLVVALLGGALAARDDRLLALATGSLLPAGPMAIAAKAPGRVRRRDWWRPCWPARASTSSGSSARPAG